MLKGLEDVVSMSEVDRLRDERGWAFTGGRFADPVNGFAFLAEACRATDPRFDGRASVPVLWDRRTGRIVNHESGEIVRMLDDAFGDLARAPGLDLYPEVLREEIARRPPPTTRTRPGRSCC
jgi:glutathionyl-hydroquinone reductase